MLFCSTYRHMSNESLLSELFRKRRDGNGAEKTDEAEDEGRVAQFVNEPTLRDALHPGADQRDKLAEEEEPVIAMAQGAEAGARR